MGQGKECKVQGLCQLCAPTHAHACPTACAGGGGSFVKRASGPVKSFILRCGVEPWGRVCRPRCASLAGLGAHFQWCRLGRVVCFAPSGIVRGSVSASASSGRRGMLAHAPSHLQMEASIVNNTSRHRNWRNKQRHMIRTFALHVEIPTIINGALFYQFSQMCRSSYQNVLIFSFSCKSALCRR